VTPALHARIMREIVVPAVNGMAADGIPYTGFLYAGVMIGADGAPKVLEFNCRFGDPETQPLMMRLKTDLVDVFEAVIDERLDNITLQWDRRASVCVVMSSGGYPGAYENGKPITGLAEANGAQDVVVFHAGTKMIGGQVVTAGGRVLGVTALGETFEAARERCYEAVAKIHFEGAYYRRDIGAKAMR